MLLLACAAGAVLLLGGSLAQAADVRKGWGSWWLPPVRSTHGDQIDALFIWTFWITMIVFIAVEALLVYFLIKYRHRDGQKKAFFTHGHTRIEMIWTIAPAIIFIALAVANKGVWEHLRFNPDGDRADKATILVIGQQFMWNVVYPGPDGQLGRYLIYPKPTDTRWPGGIKFANVTGPAMLPYEKAVETINKYVENVNPLGKDMDDPAGKDDDWSRLPGREINIPVNRPVEVQLGSKDVIHDFFLPNYRVKLDAVPGLRGKLVFTATMTSRQREQESMRPYSMDELSALFARDPKTELKVRITKDTTGAVKDKRKDQYLYVKDPKAAKWETIIRDAGDLTADSVALLKEAGIKEVTAYEPGFWELVCEELCGQGHTKMRGQVVVLDNAEYQEKFEGKKATVPTTLPAKVAAVVQ